jgi:hypothetical protein
MPGMPRLTAEGINKIMLFQRLVGVGELAGQTVRIST